MNRKQQDQQGLFAHDTPIQPWFWAILANRFQVDYFILLLPGLLEESHKVWFIILVGLLAAIPVYLTGKFLDSGGHLRLRKLSGNVWARLLMVPAAAVIVLKLTIAVKGYVGLVHQILFPSVGTGLFVFLILAGSYYLARNGMYITLRFCLMAVLTTLIILVIYIDFLFPPQAHYYHLFPIFPGNGTDYGLDAFFTMWPLYSGVEFLIVLGSWTGGKPLTKYLLAGHALTMLEYVYLFIVSLLFFGSAYLSTLEYPHVHLIRYIQLPFFERIEMFLIPLYITSYILVISILMLYLYGAFRIALNRTEKPANPKGLFILYLIVLFYFYIVDRWLWTTEIQREIWEKIQMTASGIAFVLVPPSVYFIWKFSERRAKGEKMA